MRVTTIGADIDVACAICKKPIDLELRSGLVIRCKRALLNNNQNTSPSDRKHVDTAYAGPSIHIGTNYGNVALGGNAISITSIYNETIRVIDEANNVEPEQKKQAKSLLTHAKEYAPIFLPILADMVKKSLGI